MSAQNPDVTGTAQKAQPAEVFLVYPSWTMKNALASLVNLVTLLIGISIGVMLAPHIEHPAKAVSEEPQVQSTPGAAVQPPSGFEGHMVTPQMVQPGLTVGTGGVYLLLSHHIQSDELVVNGYDMLKLQNAQLQLLSRFVPASEIQAAVNGARADHLYQAGPPPGSQPTKPPAK